MARGSSSAQTTPIACRCGSSRSTGPRGSSIWATSARSALDVSIGPDGALAYVGSTPTRPAELYYRPSPTAASKRLTNLNPDIAALQLGSTEMIAWQFEGYAQNGVLTYPPGFDRTRKYPLVLLIHGGPRGASLLSFSANAQLMAAQGWVVFQPNYRGSDNFGNDYARAIRSDAGDGPGRDVMAGLAAVKQRGFVDESRIGVSGWSYGGYMTTWMIGHYGGWKAAVAGAAVTDRLDQYNLADGNGNSESSGGSPWVDPAVMERFRAQSPISYAAQMKTPTLIMSNTGDYRVPITQSYKLYHALKDHGVPTKFIAYPMGGHNANDPVRATGCAAPVDRVARAVSGWEGGDAVKVGEERSRCAPESAPLPSSSAPPY